MPNLNAVGYGILSPTPFCRSCNSPRKTTLPICQCCPFWGLPRDKWDQYKALPLLLFVKAKEHRKIKMIEEPKPTELLPMVSEIVAAQVANNKVTPAELPQLIQDVYAALARATTGDTGPTPRGEPAVPVKKSVTPDYIVCLEDGKKLKMLKRHLRTAYDMSPEQYRQRWGLPADYPLVAPNYAKTRSKLAKQIGLGTARARKKAQALAARRSARSKRIGRK